ncbi:stage III sporulation protein AF [Lentibacillus halophilus]|uniref:Stage III sporulation protein AF n=1 Tax=Lentibacillus halophilus TaxID=295065 RepID=A0ABP3J6H4_9BACI
MGALVDWVTQIILFLLLASVVDLMIPATSMKKYIKLIVGLILILIFLKPVFYLFDMDVKRALQASYTEMMNEQPEKKDLENTMEMKKSEIQTSQRAYIGKQMAVQLKQLANEPLEKNYEQQIASIDPQFAKEVDDTDEAMKKKIEHITVYLKKPQTEEEEGEGGVAVVENVVIDGDKPESDENGIDTNGIKNLLHDVWGIDKEKMTIAREGEPS